MSVPLLAWHGARQAQAEKIRSGVTFSPMRSTYVHHAEENREKKNRGFGFGTYGCAGKISRANFVSSQAFRLFLSCDNAWLATWLLRSQPLLLLYILEAWLGWFLRVPA
ncbi:uncharacterized protein H6S33_003302 [Morchella sextelata]|uniref:uncharacterized protein n=1 Tax=Morchella sextelata TaxID=1174677 RepID=UPI001D04BF74|nr:uncharacterized protein H6S33_003302 [Morchella sextelata]KAH0607314.1 hypothetical protein H6S33_003302 [Morchella sextelata]